MRDAADEVRSLLVSRCSAKRYAHSLAVAGTAADLCRRNGIDPERGYLAGLAHDMEKGRDAPDLIEFLESRGYARLPEILPFPEALHGAAARFALEEEHGVRDGEILEAVETHCYPRQGMCPLSLCLWVADKICPGRDHFPEAFGEEISRMPIGEGFVAVMGETIERFARSGRAVYPATLFLYNALKGDRR